MTINRWIRKKNSCNVILYLGKINELNLRILTRISHYIIMLSGKSKFEKIGKIQDLYKLRKHKVFPVYGNTYVVEI